MLTLSLIIWTIANLIWSIHNVPKKNIESNDITMQELDTHIAYLRS